jgi:hypothetical protein
MSAPTLDAPEVVTDEVLPDGAVTAAPVGDADEVAPPVPVVTASLAAFLATAAAGWMTAGLFEGTLPRLIGVLGPLIGAGMVGASYRTKSPSILQYLTLPVLVVVGALFMLSDMSGGASLPRLVVEAVQQGGLNQPPVAFAPGWRFSLLVITGMLAAGSSALSISLNRAKLGLLLPVPFIFATALTQPKGAALLSSLVALGLVVGAMAVAFGADLAKQGTSSGGFEVRRLARGGAVLVAVVVLLGGLSQIGFLFPQAQEDEVVAPRRPELPPPTPDRVLFTVDSPVQIPWRLGVLDVYGLKEGAWLTPPFKRKELASIGSDGTVPLRGNRKSDGTWSTLSTPPAGRDGKTLTATFTISDVPGRTVPNVQNPLRVESNAGLQYDPRTQAFQVKDPRARSGTRYTITFPAPPDAAQLKAAPAPGPRLKEFLVAPEPPVAVDDLLRRAPTTNAFDRLQFVRNAYYTKVVAAGAGEPKDVSAQRVAELLAGGEGTPYEITAGEVLLARWAGVPARIGYGYYGGEKADPKDKNNHTLSIRPAQGAMWLEAYFEGYGWVPIVGTPPKAKASLNDKDKRKDPSVKATDELALIVYVPIKEPSFKLLFEVVRYWALRVVPLVVGLILLVVFYTGFIKMLRRGRRRRWAARGGPAERVTVAYAEFRDVANDYNFGNPIHTPLEFLLDLAPDDEHTELAWLVTRGLWGDLSRDLRPEDAVVAEQLAASLTKRLRRANGGLPLVIAFASRASLQDPYTREIPNLWASTTLRSRIAGRLRRRPGGRRRRWRGLLQRRLPSAASALILLFFLSSCGQAVDLSATTSALPAKLVPARIGDITFVREQPLEKAFARAGSLVDAGRVFSLHEGPNVQGSLQAAAFKGGLRDRQREVRDGLLANIGAGLFRLTRIGSERIYVMETREQKIYVWFAPTGRYYELMATRSAFTGSDRLFLGVLAYQRGQDAIDPSQIVPPPDPRRGLDPEEVTQ